MAAHIRGVLVVAVGAFALICACTGSGPKTADALLYWPPPGEHDVKLARLLVERWNAAHPDIPVKMQALPAGRSSEEVLLASIVGGTTPDICSNILTGTVDRMVRAGALVRLSELEGFKAWVRERSPPGTLERYASSDGGVYQLPYKANPQTLIVNRGLLARAGVEPPRTYSEFLAAAERLTVDVDGDGRTDRWAIGLPVENTWFKRFDDIMPLYVAASGGRGLIEGEEVLFGGEAMVGAVRFLGEIFARGYAPRSFFAGPLFLQGKLAMVPGSAPNIPKIEAQGDIDYDFLHFPVPDGHEGPVYSFGDIKSMVIFASTKRPKEAWAFARFLTSPEADLLLMQTTGQLPLRRELTSTEPFASHLRERPRLRSLAGRLSHVRGTDDSVHLVETMDVLSQLYESSVVLGIKPPEAGVADAARRVERLVRMWD